MEKVNGTGLGLAITRNIVEMMYGDIKVESELDRGSKFTVILNLKLQEHDISEEASFHGMKVLVVDDDPNAGESACSTLAELGIESRWVRTGAEALEQVKDAHHKKQDFSTVIVDWKMPEMNGVETTKRIRATVGPMIPVIILSAYDWSEIEQEARAAGADGFISKPLFKSRLVWQLKKLSGQKQENPRQITDLSELRLEGKRILLVEDNELNMEIAREIIGQTGAQIEFAWNGKEALDRFMETKEHYFDLIFMDIQMPVMDGYAAARAIRSTEKKDAARIPIVAMTANAFVEDARNCRLAGMNGHIAKPIDIMQLYDILEKWLKPKA